MASPLSDLELRERALAGLGPQAAALSARGEPLDGVLVALTPAAPDRSLFNSVVAPDPAALIGRLEQIANLYEEAGVRAWTVWVPDDEREAAAELERRGHRLDGDPRLMAFELSGRTAAPELPEGYTLQAGDLRTLGLLNDLAYGYDGAAWGAAMKDAGGGDLEVLLARHGHRPAACVGTIAVGDDLMITAVATDPEHQGKGLCSALLGTALERAADQGFVSSSLQASKAGAGVYARLGYRDVGSVELWERRRSDGAPSA